jgi:hypothetical protein
MTSILPTGSSSNPNAPLT